MVPGDVLPERELEEVGEDDRGEEDVEERAMKGEGVEANLDVTSCVSDRPVTTDRFSVGAFAEEVSFTLMLSDE